MWQCFRFSWGAYAVMKAREVSTGWWRPLGWNVLAFSFSFPIVLTFPSVRVPWSSQMRLLPHTGKHFFLSFWSFWCFYSQQQVPYKYVKNPDSHWACQCPFNSCSTGKFDNVQKKVSCIYAASGHHSLSLSWGSVDTEQSKQWRLNSFQE